MVSPSGRRATIGDDDDVEISAKVDYAVRAMLSLAAADPDVPVSVERLATEQGLPQKFLEGIVADLRRAELVLSRRGARGGYRLARPPQQISVGDIIRAVDGPLAEVRGQRPHETVYEGSAAHLGTVWVALRVALRRVLDETTLDRLLTGDLPPEVAELTRDPDAHRNR